MGLEKVTRDQRRAADAAAYVRQVQQEKEKVWKRYNTLAHKLPVLIRTNGLLASIAFLDAKSDDAGAAKGAKLLAAHIRSQLQSAGLAGTRDALLTEDLARLSYGDYLKQQEEAVRCAVWHKRFSAALFGVPDEEDETAAPEAAQ